MAFEVRFPAVGESVTEGAVYRWHKKDGDFINRDDVLLEVETDKATVEIVAEASGKLAIKKKEGETVAVGEVLATLDTEAKGGELPKVVEPTKADLVKTTPVPGAQPNVKSGEKPLSPAVQRMAAEHQIDTSKVDGTGRDGRITKTDMVSAMSKGAAPASAATKPVAPKSSISSGPRAERREKMSRIRSKIAERLVAAQHNAAMLTTFNEIDMSKLMELRNQYKDKFKEAHGVNLGFMSFFVKAAVEALKTFPAINGWIEGDEIVYHDYYDVGVAVSTERGLMVPVVRDCDKLSFAEIEQAILGYSTKARDGKISLDDLSGGTFTVSNGGVFGSLLSTPILNPPQSAILGMHKTEKRAVVVNDQIVIRPMMYVAMSYDHRIVDGKEAVSFLVKIKDAIEDPARLLLGV